MLISNDNLQGTELGCIMSGFPAQHPYSVKDRRRKQKLYSGAWYLELLIMVRTLF